MLVDSKTFHELYAVWMIHNIELRGEGRGKRAQIGKVILEQTVCEYLPNLSMSLSVAILKPCNVEGSWAFTSCSRM